MITSFGFSGGWRPGQLAIQAATFDPSAHCFAVINGTQIIDATYAHGVSLRKLEDVQAHWLKFLNVKFLTPSQNLMMEDWLRCQIGKKYDKGFVFGWPFGRNWQDPTEWACSELVGGGLVEVGALVIPKMHRLTPRNLRRRLEEKQNEK